MSQFYSPARGLVPNLDIPSTETIILTTNVTIQHLSVSKIYRLAFVDEPVLLPDERPCAPPFENFEKVRKKWHSLKSSVVLVTSYLMGVNSKN